MRRKARSGMRGAAALALLAALAACTSLTGEPEIGVTRTGEVQAPPVEPPASDEATAERENARIVERYGGVYSDRAAEIALAQIVGRLLTAANRPADSYTITVLDSPQVNAFALPGGFVYVTRGLLALGNDASELAAVLAHEMAHVTLRHAQARSSRARTTEIVDRVLGGILGVDPETDQSSARAKQSLAAFSQQQELEADAEGIRVAAAAGYDADAAARFLGQMGRYAALTEGENAPGLRPGDFLSSHPSTPSRIEKAIDRANQVGGTGGERGRSGYLAAIDGLSFGNNPDAGAVVGNRYVDKRDDLAFEVPERYRLTQTEDSVVATSPEGTAMRFDSVEVPAEMSLEDYLKSGWAAGLVDESVRSESIGGVDVARAEARTEQWVFRLAVLRHREATYRFIFAAASDSPRFEQDFEQTVGSFRRARSSDIRRIRALQISIVEAKIGDSTDTLVARMEVASHGADLFYALNGLFPGDPITPGEHYKIVIVKR